jgi:hypothetical protein
MRRNDAPRRGIKKQYVLVFLIYFEEGCNKLLPVRLDAANLTRNQIQ